MILLRIALRFVKMARKYWGEMIITVISLILASGLNLVTPEIVRRFTGCITNTSLLSAETLIRYSIILVVAYLIRAVLRFIAMYVSHIAAWSFVGDLTLMMYDKMQNLSLGYFKDKQTGQLMSRIVNDTRLLEVLIAHSVPDMISNVAIAIGVTVMIFLINPYLALLTIIPVPFVFFSGIVFSKKVMPLFKINQRVLGELNGEIQDNLSGIKEIQAFGQESREYRKMKDWCKHYSEVNIHANFANAIFHPSVEFLTSIGTIIVVGVGGVLAMRGTMSASDIVGFFMYLSLFYTPIAALARLAEDIQTAFAGEVRILEVLDAESEVQDSSDSVIMESCDGSIELDHVSFGYRDEKKVLDDVSLKIRPGEMVAFVGPTGVGKTTLISLLERFYDPQEGSIYVGGKNIKDITLSSLRSNISLVLQDVFLFNGTVADNISYGLENATRDRIEAAAKTACIYDFIMTLPDGFDTMIGERGALLSGGQKQRIAIARAVLRDTPILILDEATSSVDTETEFQIQQSIDRLSENRTVIVIAHRLSTVMKADNIVVLSDGRITEQGSHRELLEMNGKYARMCGI